MGEVTVELVLENAVDRGMFRRKKLKEKEVRKATINAVVDTGAVMMMLPQDLVEELGVEEIRKVIVTYADERKEERPVAGPISVKVGNREASVDCVVGPPGSEALFGQIPIEAMDLIVDCPNRSIGPRPESPYLPTLKLK